MPKGIREDQKRILVTVPQQVHEKIKMISKKTGVSMNGMMLMMIDQYLTGKQFTERLPEMIEIIKEEQERRKQLSLDI